MEKRNTLLLTVIAVATLLVAVVGATFAYFANDAQVTNVANLVANTASSSSSFVSEKTDLTLTVLAAQMTQAGANATNDTVANTSTNGNVVVKFTAGTTETLTCTYDLYYEWKNAEATPSSDANDGEYIITPNATKEFTYTVARTVSGAPNGAADANGAIATDVQFVNSTAANDGHTKLVTGYTITNASASTETVHNYSISAKFYNLNINQNANSGETYTIEFGVENVQC